MNGNRVLILIGLSLTLGAGNLPLGSWGRHLVPGGMLIGSEILWWVAVLVCPLYVVFVEKRPLASIGLRWPNWLDLVSAIPAGIGMVIGIILIFAIAFPLLHLHMNSDVMNRLLAKPFWFRTLLVTRAAVAEEMLFRGYPIERLKEWTGNGLLAAAISLAAFTIAHLPSWGWSHLLVAGFGGVILTALYLWRRNLWANMLAHWIADAAGFLVPHG